MHGGEDSGPGNALIIASAGFREEFPAVLANVIAEDHAKAENQERVTTGQAHIVWFGRDALVGW